MNNAEIIKIITEEEQKYGLVNALHRMLDKNIKVRIPFSQKASEANVDNLILSVRSYNALRRGNIFTVGDLIETLNEGELKNVRNLGAKSCREIQTKLLIYGFENLSKNRKGDFWRYLVENNTLNQ